MNSRLISVIIMAACVGYATVTCYKFPRQVRELYPPCDKYKLYYTGFTVQYNTSTRQPDWVEYTLTAQQVRATENTPKIPRHIMPDPNISLPQASNEDYHGVFKDYGLTKGHMTRRQDMKWSLQAVQESDYYTNICPQHKTLNNNLWNDIENLVRKVALRYDSVHVVCGPIFTDTALGHIGPHRIPVPDLFFKTLLIKDATGYHSIAFLCPNRDIILDIKDVVRTVDQVEAISKVDVYSYLNNRTEATVEKQKELSRWLQSTKWQ